MNDFSTRLARLREAATSDAPLPALRKLAPEHLDDVFEIELATRILQGPDTDGADTVRRFLRLAQQASSEGIVSVATPAVLRAFLNRLTEDLKAEGGWEPTAPLWFSPLPPLSPLEELWLSCEKGVTTPEQESLEEAFAGPRWMEIENLLAPNFVRRLAQEVEAADGAGKLGLERAGTGESEQIGVQRHDSVRYLDGREPELIAVAPTLAIFIQWALQRLDTRLRGAGQIFPPQRAMLARYPAPSDGYSRHLDNPQDANERALTLVVYLGTPEAPCRGGEIALWEDVEAEEPSAELRARPGSAVLFDSRTVPHAVRPIEKGPDRWALTFWLSATLQSPLVARTRPRLGVSDALLRIPNPPLPAGTTLFHELGGRRATGSIVVRKQAQGRRPRAGIVCTVYRAGETLDAWCAHHLTLGFDHLILIFDHLDEPAEASVAARLETAHPESRLTIWSGPEALNRQLRLPREMCDPDLEALARSGSSAWAVAARQSLNASAALLAAREGVFGGAPLDWLVHLDADELFYCEGAGRGGGTPASHFAAAEHGGLDLLRYLNHELLGPPSGGPRFKCNPNLAASKLGPHGWAELSDQLDLGPDAERPWFHGYLNGKSAVRVEAALSAAGVHGFSLKEDVEERKRVLAGPSILHFRWPSAAALLRKASSFAESPRPEGDLPFQISATEEAALDVIRAAREAGEEPSAHIERFHHRLTQFKPGEIELLDTAGLILRPRLKYPLPVR